MTSLAVAAISLPYLKVKPEDPEEAKKPKLQNGCNVSNIMSALVKPAFKLAADGTLLEIRGTLDSNIVMTKIHACRQHVQNAEKNPEVVITFTDRRAAPSAPSPANP